MNHVFTLTCVLATNHRRKCSMERVSYLSVIMKNEFKANHRQCRSGEGIQDASRTPHARPFLFLLIKGPLSWARP